MSWNRCSREERLDGRYTKGVLPVSWPGNGPLRRGSERASVAIALLGGSMASEKKARSKATWWIVGAAVAAAALVLTVVLVQISADDLDPSMEGNAGVAAIPTVPPVDGVLPAPEESLPAEVLPPGDDREPVAEVGIADLVEVAKGVTAQLSGFNSVEGEARIPGDIAGPAVRVSVKVSNESGSTIRLDGAVVNLYYGEARTPAIANSWPVGKPFPAELANGDSTVGAYVFSLPSDQRTDVRVEVDIAGVADPVMFVGAIPQ